MRLRFGDLKARIEQGDIGDIAVLHQACRWSIAEDALNSGKPGWFADPEPRAGRRPDRRRHLLDGSLPVAVEQHGRRRLKRGRRTWFTRTLPSKTGAWRRSRSPAASSPRSRRRGPSTRLEKPGPLRNRTASSGSRWSEREERSSISGSAHRAAPCLRPAQRTGCTSASPSRRTRCRRPFPLTHLIECLNTGRQPAASIQDARQTFVVAMAAYESALNRPSRTGPAVTSPSEPPRHLASGGGHPPELARRFGLLEATALNMTNMMGVGPFITIPLLMTALGGPQAMLGWVVALAHRDPDGMVWSELGSAMPGSGGSYVYLREGWPREVGRLAAFLFIWQFILSGPLEIASGYIGFSQYSGYLWPSLTTVQYAMIAAAVRCAEPCAAVPADRIARSADRHALDRQPPLHAQR